VGGGDEDEDVHYYHKKTNISRAQQIIFLISSSDVRYPLS